MNDATVIFEQPEASTQKRQPKKFHQRFDPKSVQPLVDKAKAGDVAARDQLVMQFRRLISSLITLCTTAKINPGRNGRSAHIRFLQLFCGPNTPLDNMAHKLKRELSMYSVSELWHVGELSLLEAVYKTKANYSATVVQCFKEHIKQMTVDGIPHHSDEAHLSSVVCQNPESQIVFDIWVNSLPAEDRAAVEAILAGEKGVSIPDSLRAHAAFLLT